MKLSKKFSAFFLLALGCTAFVWLYAQDTSSETSSSDKWAEIQQNHKNMLSAFDEIDQNLQFIKIRAMQRK